MQHRSRQLQNAIKSLVDQRVEHWKRQRVNKPVDEPVSLPIITVSRQPGAGGEELATRVAEAMGFELWDSKLVQEIADREGAGEALIASLDEHVQSRLEEFLDGLVLPQGTMSEYLRQLGVVVRGLEHQGNAVVVGRGGQFLVSGERALRIRVVGSETARRARIAEREDISDKQAAARIREQERERSAFYTRYFGHDEDDASRYDIVVNADALGMDAACRLVVQAYEAKFGSESA